jgi:hypothetical protein
VIVADARNVGTTAVYVPPVARVRFPAMLTVPETVQVEPVKMRFLNQLPKLMLNVEAPALTVKFGAFVVVPPAALPKNIVAVAA